MIQRNRSSLFFPVRPTFIAPPLQDASKVFRPPPPPPPPRVISGKTICKAAQLEISTINTDGPGYQRYLKGNFPDFDALG